MTDDRDAHQERLRRLTRALDITIQRDEGALTESDEEFLDRHSELRDLLEPMIRGSSSSGAPAATHSAEASTATPAMEAESPRRRRLLLVGMAATAVVGIVVAMASFVLQRRANDRLMAAHADSQRASSTISQLERDLRIVRDEKEALSRDREQANAERVRAAEERDATAGRSRRESAIAEFTRSWFSSSAPGVQSPDDSIARELDRAAGQIDAFVAGDPDAEPGVRTFVGMGYLRVGLWSAAALQLEKARTTARAKFGVRSREAIDATTGLAAAYHGLGKWSDADLLCRELVAAEREIFGEAAAPTLEIAARWASVLADRMDFEGAERVFRDTLEAARVGLSDDDAFVMRTTKLLGDLLRRRGRLDEAEELLRGVLALETKSLGAADAQTLSTTQLLARVIRDRGDLAGAESLALEAYAGQARLSSQDSPCAIETRFVLASIWSRQGRHVEAEAEWRRILAIERTRHGAGSVEALRGVHGLATTLVDFDRARESGELIRDAWATARSTLGDDSPVTLDLAGDLAESLSLAGGDRLAEAADLWRTTSEAWARSAGTEHPATLQARSSLASVLARQSRWTEVEEIRRSIWTCRVRIDGEVHPRTLRAAYDLADALEGEGHAGDAEATLVAAAESAKRILPPGCADGAEFSRRRGAFLARQRRFDEAAALLTETLTSARATLGARDAETCRVKETLIALYEAWGRPDLASRIRSDDEALDGLREVDRRTPAGPLTVWPDGTDRPHGHR
ncbi:MAG: tetratricopeptide repeat protein [Planctomycetes bacterium]|nr:tetratricopeptide repeat protein [Planctomycetota bacterium]